MKFNSTQQLRSALLDVIPDDVLKHAPTQAPLAAKSLTSKSLDDNIEALKSFLKGCNFVETMKYSRAADRMYVYFKPFTFTTGQKMIVSQTSNLTMRRVGDLSCAIDNASKVVVHRPSKTTSKAQDSNPPIAEAAATIFEESPTTPASKKSRLELLQHLDMLEGSIPYTVLVSLKKAALEMMPPRKWETGGLSLTILTNQSVKLDLDNIYEGVKVHRDKSNLTPLQIGYDLTIRFEFNGVTKKRYDKAAMWLFSDVNDDEKMYAVIRTKTGVHEHFSVSCK